MRIVAAKVESWTLPLEPPVRGMTCRPGVRITLVSEGGRVGRGDAAPWPGFGAGLQPARAALEVAAAAIVGSERAALDACSGSPEALFALETALLAVSGALATTDPGPAPRKVKVGGRPLDEDDARVAAVRAEIGPDAALRIDANGAWSAPEAIEAIGRLERHGLELVEQPTASIEDLAIVRAAVGTAVAADESAADEAALEALIAAGAADVVVIKPMFVGGMAVARRMAQRSRAAGLDVVVTHALGTDVSRAGAVHLAASLGGGRPHGLGPRPSLPDDPPDAEPPMATAIPNPVASSALARPDRPALERGDERLSWSELRDRVARCAGALQALGIRAGHTVGLVGPRAPEWVVTFHALGWLGAAVAPIPTGAPQARLAEAIETLRPDIVVAQDDEPLPSGTPVVRLGEGAGAHPVAERFWPLEEARIVVLTSGTTGRARAIRLTTLQLVTSAFGSAIRLGHDPEDRWLCCLPLSHVGGLSILVRCALYGITTVLGTAQDHRRATLASMVPTQLEGLLDAGQDLSGLRAVLVGGAAAPDALLARCAALGLPVAVTWGMTEAASQIATCAPGEATAGAVGPPLAFARVSAVDDVLVVRGPVVRGVLASRDRGAVSDSGVVAVAGRIDDVIVSGGENIDPARVEAALVGHPGVREAIVVGVPDQRWGERPVAWLVGEPGSPEPGADELKTWCLERLRAFEVPDRFGWRDRLPTTDLGKRVRNNLETT